MRITELARLTGATTDEIRYFERKDYIRCRWLTLRARSVRDYEEAEVQKVELLIKYRRDGFELDTAYTKAMDELQQPRLI
jgi:DNA-binding transcriptional MerR regulator